MHTNIYAHGYCRWKPIEPKDKENARNLLPDIRSEEMPYGCRGLLTEICFDTGCHGSCPSGSEVKEEEDGWWLVYDRIDWRG